MDKTIPTLCEEEHILLHRMAKDAIASGLNHQKPISVDSQHYPRLLRQSGASFVTLKINDALRGCIGTLEARQALIADVAHNAYAAAFSDPRFTPLSLKEFDQLEIHISVLTPAEPMTFHSEEDLLQQIRPNIDGLVLEEGRHRGTFLPSVWESLPTAEQYLRQLKRKAGLAENYWSDTVKVSRYTTESF